MHHYWPDLELPVYLIANERQFSSPGVRQILVGPDVSWSDNLLRALEMVEHSYVLLALDDLILKETVDSGLIQELCSWIALKKPDYLRLTVPPFPDKRENALVGRLLPGGVYRTSTIWPIWKKDTLARLLRSGETAWEFEILGTARSDAYPNFYATRRNAVRLENAVIRGRWNPKAVRMLRKHGAFPAENKRPIMSAMEEFKYKLSHLRSVLFYLVPSAYRRSVRAALKRA